jgi:hypothetical protein
MPICKSLIPLCGALLILNELAGLFSADSEPDRVLAAAAKTSRPHTDLVNLEAGTAQYWASDEVGMHGGSFCHVAVRLVEDMLADLHRLDVFRGPTGGNFPLVKIHCTTGTVR